MVFIQWYLTVLLVFSNCIFLIHVHHTIHFMVLSCRLGFLILFIYLFIWFYFFILTQYYFSASAWRVEHLFWGFFLTDTTGKDIFVSFPWALFGEPGAFGILTPDSISDTFLLSPIFPTSIKRPQATFKHLTLGLPTPATIYRLQFTTLSRGSSKIYIYCVPSPNIRRRPFTIIPPIKPSQSKMQIWRRGDLNQLVQSILDYALSKQS